VFEKSIRARIPVHCTNFSRINDCFLRKGKERNENHNLATASTLFLVLLRGFFFCGREGIFFPDFDRPVLSELIHRASVFLDPFDV
jgi:hypothetical protein